MLGPTDPQMQHYVCIFASLRAGYVSFLHKILLKVKSQIFKKEFYVQLTSPIN